MSIAWRSDSAAQLLQEVGLVPHTQTQPDGAQHQQNQQQHNTLLMQQLLQHQQKHAGLSPFSIPANQLDVLDGKPLGRCSCPGLLGLQEQEDSETDSLQLTSMLSSSWCDSSMSISRQSCSTASMRSLTSSPLQHWQELLPGPLFQEHYQHQHPQHIHHHQQQHVLHHHQQHVQPHHHQPHQQQHPVLAPPGALTCTPCSPCCSASSEFGDLCCCKVMECSNRDTPGNSLAHNSSSAQSSCRCAARAGSNSSTQSSNTNRSDSSHCSSGTDAHADCATDTAEAAANLICRSGSTASTWSNKSHHVGSRPAPGGDLSNGMTWVMPKYGGREVLADYEFGQTLGCGTFGVTRLVTHRKTASLWACKTICKASIAASPAAQSDVQHEVAILQHLRGHKGIVQLKGVYEDERNIHLVMELCTGGDLLDYISRFQRLQENEAADVASVMLSTLAHCHRLGIVHRDIKPENFLLGAPTLLSAPAGTAAQVLKISDFGVSAFHQPGERFSEIVGTPFYMAPEVLERCYGPEADIWSVGVVVFLMLAGRLPFDGATDRQIIKAVLDSEPDFDHPAWAGISAVAKSCVARMLVKDPRHRATVQELLSHPWLSGRMRSSCCSNAGDDAAAVGPGAARCCAAACSGSREHGPAVGDCQCSAGSSSSRTRLLQHTDSSTSSSSRVCGVSWALPCGTELDSSCASPRERRDSSPTPRKPLLSPLKHVRQRAGLQ